MLDQEWVWLRRFCGTAAENALDLTSIALSATVNYLFSAEHPDVTISGTVVVTGLDAAMNWSQISKKLDALAELSLNSDEISDATLKIQINIARGSLLLLYLLATKYYVDKQLSESGDGSNILSVFFISCVFPLGRKGINYYLSRFIKERRFEILKLVQEHPELRRRIDSLTSELGATRQGFEVERRRLNATIQDLTDNLNNLERRRQELENGNDDMRHGLTAQIEGIQEKLEKAENNLKLINVERARLTQGLEVAIATNRELTQRTQITERELKSETERADIAEGSLAAVNIRANEAESKLAAATAANDDLKRQLAAANTRADEAESNLRTEIATNRALRQGVETAERELKVVTAKAENDLREANTRIAELQQKVATRVATYPGETGEQAGSVVGFSGSLFNQTTSTSPENQEGTSMHLDDDRKHNVSPTLGAGDSEEG